MPVPVADVKAGINAGGLAGADVNASVGAGGAGIGVSGAVNEKGAKVSAGVDAGSDGGAGGATAEAGGANVGAGVDAGADAATGALNGSAGVSAEAGGAKVSAGVNADADTATGAVNGSAGVSAEAGGAKVGADADVAGDGEANGPIGARTAVAATAPAQGTSSILLPPPLLPLQGQQGDDAGSIGVQKTQLAMLGCIDPLADGTCPTEPQAIPQFITRFEIVDEADGAANVATSSVVPPTQGVGPTYPQPRVSQSFGIALADPVRTKSGLVVRCIIVNTSNRNQPIPRLDVRLLNSAGEVVAHSVLSAPSDALAGGQEKTFEVRIRSLPPHAKRLAVSLVSPN